MWARVLLVVGALLIVASGGTLVGGHVLIARATSAIGQQNLLGDAGVGSGEAANVEGPVTMLLVGLDVRGDQHDDSVRSDTILIAHIPASHDQAYLVSIPRDTRVAIPDYPKTGFTGYSTKINAAFQGGYRGPGTESEKRARGVELLAMTVEQLTGIEFTGAAIIDFGGFEAVLRELGGVTLCVERRSQAIHLAKDENGKVVKAWYDEAAGKVRGIPAGGSLLYYEPGCQRMTPQLALEYSRLRKGTCCPNGDYDRQRHQQQLIKAIITEATSKGVLTDPGRLNRIVKAAGSALVLDTQGVPVANFLFTFKSLGAKDLVLVKTNAGKVNTVPGTTDERLSEESLQTFAAIRDKTLTTWLASHPELIAR
ncbi:LCP family protein [Phytohabitans sp. ZYX-F-186]|uniref:LCP family protein n=1 Tax=Phytohabitans maris TaxID=3071409 RepID=A0ABU0ZVX1_9ACTN|nr:LCP family protein [Phytohabitans sp. ZYX-F-186]MDQ7910355.1 LCP family protein [Phytohabitans sp. ZYX-F-186]